jgi:EmrB/QacA subfamily drug resistance transporter
MTDPSGCTTPRAVLSDGHSLMASASPRWTLVVSVLGSSMAFLDGSLVNVALPVMQRHLRIDVGLAQWVIEAYLLLLSSLVLVGGALGDRFGRRRTFVVGVVVFALASAACGAAPAAPFLIAARAVQGAGAALLVPGSLSLITAAYPDGKERGAAIGTWSAASGVMAAAGPVVGGWVVAHASWRWLFFANAPIAAAVLVLSLARVEETRDPTATGRVDVPGALLITLSLGLIVYALVDAGGEAGIGGARILSLLAAGGVGLVAFVLVEHRSAAPMVPLQLFRAPTFAGTNLLTFLLYGALGCGLFFLPFDLIQVEGYSPTAAGAALLPLVLLISAMSRSLGALAGRIGPRPLLVAGPIVSAVGFGLLARPAAGGSYWTTFFPGVAVLGLGMGITVAPLTAAVMGSVEPRHAGVASGINNAVASASGLLAVAALGVVLVARFDAALDEQLARMSLAPGVLQAVASQRSRLAGADLTAVVDPTVRESLRRAIDDAYVTGFRAVLQVCSALAALGAVAAFAFVGREKRRARIDPAPERPA